MLTITHAARHHIAGLLSPESRGKVLRISSGPEGLQLAIDRVRIGDTTFNDGDKCILAIDQMLLLSVAGQTLDVECSEGRTVLVLLGA